jgi:hypothetical protein
MISDKSCGCRRGVRVANSHPLSTALLATVTVFGAGCAAHPAGRNANAGSSASSSLSSELTLLQAASDLGYSPTVVEGKTVFCKREQLTGSMVPSTFCVEGDAVVAQARTQKQNIEALSQQPTPGKYPPP